MFIGLMLGGVLADRYDRRKLILFARGTCGLGFVALSLNAFAPAPSLWALYLLAAWDGFFGALGMTALMAVIPLLVGRENLAAAGGLEHGNGAHRRDPGAGAGRDHHRVRRRGAGVRRGRRRDAGHPDPAGAPADAVAAAAGAGTPAARARQRLPVCLAQ